MKLFIYKSIFILVIFFIGFHLTFGYLIKSIENKLYNNFSTKKLEYIKDKIRDEIKSANKKNKILYPDDAKLLGEFIKKIISEIN